MNVILNTYYILHILNIYTYYKKFFFNKLFFQIIVLLFALITHIFIFFVLRLCKDNHYKSLDLTITL